MTHGKAASEIPEGVRPQGFADRGSVPHSARDMGLVGQAARFNSDEAAETFVRRHVEGEDWGLFPG